MGATMAELPMAMARSTSSDNIRGRHVHLYRNNGDAV